MAQPVGNSDQNDDTAAVNGSAPGSTLEAHEVEADAAAAQGGAHEAVSC